MTTHVWIGPQGEDWTPDAASDRCAQCGSTPDVHPIRVEGWALQEAREIVYLVGGPGLAYHTRVRREKEVARRLMAIRSNPVAEHSCPQCRRVATRRLRAALRTATPPVPGPEKP